MKKITLLSIVLFAFILSTAFKAELNNSESADNINWVSWNEAIELNKKSPKKMFIDVYTNWCGYCKKMDRETFTDKAIADFINENFYAIKFNAEMKEEIEYGGTTFKFVKGGRRGYHQLAQALLDGRMGYPSFVYLDEEMTRIMMSPGYKTPDMLMKELKFAQGEHYKNTSWEKYRKAN